MLTGSNINDRRVQEILATSFGELLQTDRPLECLEVTVAMVDVPGPVRVCGLYAQGVIGPVQVITYIGGQILMQVGDSALTMQSISLPQGVYSPTGFYLLGIAGMPGAHALVFFVRA